MAKLSTCVHSKWGAGRKGQTVLRGKGQTQYTIKDGHTNSSILVKGNEIDSLIMALLKIRAAAAETRSKQVASTPQQLIITHQTTKPRPPATQRANFI